jgi:hypothetical protein
MLIRVQGKPEALIATWHRLSLTEGIAPLCQAFDHGWSAVYHRQRCGPRIRINDPYVEIHLFLLPQTRGRWTGPGLFLCEAGDRLLERQEGVHLRVRHSR